jgi:anti-sigma factor ChrR (cupin superfamily)
MSVTLADSVEFDDVLTLAFAQLAQGAAPPRPGVRERIIAAVEALPLGFAFSFDAEQDWLPHRVPGIRMKILAVNRASNYAALLLDVAPHTRLPPHHHSAAEECLVIEGTMMTCGRRLAAGDFVHADAGTDHGELWTDEGCRVLLVVPAHELDLHR